MEEYLSDQELVRQALAGDSCSFGLLVERHQQVVFRIVFRLLKNREEAEDVAQESFLRCYQNLHRYDQSRPFTPWLYRIATNLALSRLRRLKNRFVSWDLIADRLAGRDSFPSQDGSRLGACPETAWEEEETRREMMAALKRLKPLDQTVIILRYFEEQSYEDIAYILGTTRNNVEVRLSRARQKLRAMIGAGHSGGFRRNLLSKGVRFCSHAEK